MKGGIVYSNEKERMWYVGESQKQYCERVLYFMILLHKVKIQAQLIYSEKSG